MHRAQLRTGETLAIKVQYPGVKDSIDSDVKNVASLLRMTVLVPANLNVKPIIEEGRKQLHQEADYHREAEYLCRFSDLLSGDENFDLPQYYPKLSTDKILAMSYKESRAIEDMVDASQQTRDKIVSLLIDLLMRELFVFKVMQTDPNFANYRYDAQTDCIVLFDFGASRDIEDDISGAYKTLMKSVLSGDKNECFDAATRMGFIAADMPARYKTAILDIIDMAIEPLQHDGPFDFGDNTLALKMRSKGMELA